MAEYIERGQILTLLKKNSSMQCDCLISVLENLPAADVAEVVRCRDCCRADTCTHRSIIFSAPLNRDDDFCSCGARMDGGYK